MQREFRYRSKWLWNCTKGHYHLSVFSKLFSNHLNARYIKLQLIPSIHTHSKRTVWKWFLLLQCFCSCFIAHWREWEDHWWVLFCSPVPLLWINDVWCSSIHRGCLFLCPKLQGEWLLAGSVSKFNINSQDTIYQESPSGCMSNSCSQGKQKQGESSASCPAPLSIPYSARTEPRASLNELRSLCEGGGCRLMEGLIEG